MDHVTVEQIFLSAVDDQLDNQLRFLREAQTQSMAHTEGALLDHLLGTRQLLIDWEAFPAVCDAGLFHSVYGTEHYEPAAIPLSMRADVRRLIGDDAELLAWLFCAMRRETFDQNLSRMGELMVQHRVSAEWLPLTTAQFHDLVTMTFANTLEAFPRLSWRVRRACHAYLRPFRSRTISAAQTAFDEFDSHWWQFWK